jgi:hypothetical protein
MGALTMMRSSQKFLSCPVVWLMVPFSVLAAEQGQQEIAYSASSGYAFRPIPALPYPHACQVMSQ